MNILLVVGDVSGRIRPYLYTLRCVYCRFPGEWVLSDSN